MASLLTRAIARAATPSYVRRLAAPVAAAPEALKQTALFDSHVALGGKMVPFAGYEMPVEYEGEGIKDSHLFVRANAGLFDVSHMGQIRLRGADRVRFLETLVVADVAGLAPGAATLSLFTTATGGIIDDTIITNLEGEDATGLVINAGCKDKDIKHIREHLEGARARGLDVALEIIEDHELLALQGPRAMDALAALLGAAGAKNAGIDLARMAFMTARPMDLVGATCLVTRCGYTGEDGFEISVPKTHVLELFDALLARDDVRPAGLGARDSLRLEAGLCLYGNDIDDTTTPIEAGLTWTVGKRRREEGGFLGSDVILGQLRDGVDRRRVAFEVPKGAPARGHEAICNEAGEEIGVVTSGCYSPSLGRAIGMGYCKKPYVKAGTPIQFKVRNRTIDAVIRKMPLVPSNYYKVPT
jgi:aminomethyltransferase